MNTTESPIAPTTIPIHTSAIIADQKKITNKINNNSNTSIIDVNNNNNKDENNNYIFENTNNNKDENNNYIFENNNTNNNKDENKTNNKDENNNYIYENNNTNNNILENNNNNSGSVSGNDDDSIVEEVKKWVGSGAKSSGDSGGSSGAKSSGGKSSGGGSHDSGAKSSGGKSSGAGSRAGIKDSGRESTFRTNYSWLGGGGDILKPIFKVFTSNYDNTSNLNSWEVAGNGKFNFEHIFNNTINYSSGGIYISKVGRTTFGTNSGRCGGGGDNIKPIFRVLTNNNGNDSDLSACKGGANIVFNFDNILDNAINYNKMHKILDNDIKKYKINLREFLDRGIYNQEFNTSTNRPIHSPFPKLNHPFIHHLKPQFYGISTSLNYPSTDFKFTRIIQNTPIPNEFEAYKRIMDEFWSSGIGGSGIGYIGSEIKEIGINRIRKNSERNNSTDISTGLNNLNNLSSVAPTPSTTSTSTHRNHHHLGNYNPRPNNNFNHNNKLNLHNNKLNLHNNKLNLYSNKLYLHPYNNKLNLNNNNLHPNNNKPNLHNYYHEMVVELKEGSNRKVVKLMQRCMEFEVGVEGKKRRKMVERDRKYEYGRLVELFGVMRKERGSVIDARVHEQFRHLLEMMICRGLTSNWLMLKHAKPSLISEMYAAVTPKHANKYTHKQTRKYTHKGIAGKGTTSRGTYTHTSKHTDIDGGNDSDDGSKGELYTFTCGRLVMVFVTDACMASNLKMIFPFEHAF